MGALRSPAPRVPSPPGSDADEGALELAEVPATVVCATCGLPECNCDEDRPSSFSGVLAIVPWERASGGMASRLWATAKLATLSPGAFFAALPPGPVAAPLSFAVLAEALAALGLGATLGGFVAMIVPGLLAELVGNAPLRLAILHGTAWGVPGLTLSMVLLHAGHGLALDAAARRQGSRQVGRGLRFGLYSCGWDLVTLPLGLVLLSLTDGPIAGLKHSARGLTAPNSAALAYLAHVHRLDTGPAARAAKRAIAVVFVPLLGVVLLGFTLGLAWASR